ncbi:MAG: hypothetical protein IT348_03925 [Candidatus Eisenbacteria bacterium]|nr:hypothetical protein [Candidatus Eisenbacteria bacterium]
MNRKQFLYRIQPTRPAMLIEGPTAEEARLVGEHYDHLERLLGEGIVLMAGRTLNSDTSAFGIVVFTADTPQQAMEIVNEDPAVKHGIMHAELYPYRVSLWSPAGPAVS